jgi:hypothetical protein
MSCDITLVRERGFELLCARRHQGTSAVSESLTERGFGFTRTPRQHPQPSGYTGGSITRSITRATRAPVRPVKASDVQLKSAPDGARTPNRG